MKTSLTVLLLFIAGTVLASSGHGEHAEGPVEVPRSVLYQAINVVILLAGLIYFLKETVVKFYQDRKRNYLAAAEKSKSARDEAEKQFVDIKHKIEQLENTADESISRARAEAVDMKQALRREAEELAKKLRHEAEETAKIEVIKAHTHLKEQLLKDSLAAAKTVLTKDIGAADHQKLQVEFINNVQAVNP